MNIVLNFGSAVQNQCIFLNFDSNVFFVFDEVIIKISGIFIFNK